MSNEVWGMPDINCDTNYSGSYVSFYSPSFKLARESGHQNSGGAVSRQSDLHM